MKAPLKVGDKVKKWSSWNEKLGQEIWVVGAIRSAISQSGYVCDVYIESNPDRKMWGYDCDWYVKITE